MRIVLITGMSGSGKSVAIRLLEDAGFYCVDNLPAAFLTNICGFLADTGHPNIAVSIDARSEAVLDELPARVEYFRALGYDVKVLFLTASSDALIQRYSESRRRHPLSTRFALDGQEATLEEAIKQERELLSPLNTLGAVIDTSDLKPAILRNWVREFVDSPPVILTLAFESFAFKHGIPVAADMVFDVRNLSNPFYDPVLRPLTGLDEPVARFLEQAPRVAAMIKDIGDFLINWLPSYLEDNRHYVTVAIGCTGGQHRSAYVVEQLARRFREQGVEHVLVRHRALQR